MFENIEVEENGRTNLAIEGLGCDIVVRRSSGTNGEIVIYQGLRGNVNVRFAKTPYRCKLILEKGKDEDDPNWIEIGLDDEDDWGNINLDLDNPRWGNEDDGYRTILSVEALDGYPHGTEIPLDVFARDVRDCIIYYEG